MNSNKVVIDKKDNITIVKVNGDFITYMRDDIQSHFYQLAEEVNTDIMLDLQNSDFMDSSGVALIVHLYKKVHSLGHELKIINTQHQPLSVFRLLEIDKIISIS